MDFFITKVNLSVKVILHCLKRKNVILNVYYVMEVVILVHSAQETGKIFQIAHVLMAI